MYQTQTMRSAYTKEEMCKKEIVHIADRLIAIRQEKDFDTITQGFCDTLAVLALVQSRFVLKYRRQRELNFQEAALEHYVQQREAGEIFNNWVDDI